MIKCYTPYLAPNNLNSIVIFMIKDNLTTLSQLYQALDDLFDQDTDADTLFASGYLRGFISLSATEFGDEKQNISTALVNKIDENLVKAKNELSPQDGVIVKNFWLQLQSKFILS